MRWPSCCGADRTRASGPSRPTGSVWRQGLTDTESLTVEDIRDHFTEIRDEDGYLVPANLTEELMATLAALGG